MSRREHLDERDVGISPAAAVALGALFEEPEPTRTVHFVLPRSAKIPIYEPSRSACGIDGVEPYTNKGTTSEHSVTCEACRAKLEERHAREDRRALQSLAKAPKPRIRLHGPRRDRLASAGLIEVRGALVMITEAGRAALKGEV